MPGKVNPVMPEVVLQVAAQVIGNDTAITIGGMQGQFELNVRIPLIARNLLQSLELLTNASTLLAEKCVDGIEANLEGCERSAEGTLAVATALNPFIGYDKAAEIVKAASASGGTLRDTAREHGVDEETLDKALDLRKIAAGSKADVMSDLERRPGSAPHPQAARAARLPPRAGRRRGRPGRRRRRSSSRPSASSAGAARSSPSCSPRSAACCSGARCRPRTRPRRLPDRFLLPPRRLGGLAACGRGSCMTASRDPRDRGQGGRRVIPWSSGC